MEEEDTQHHSGFLALVSAWSSMQHCSLTPFLYRSACHMTEWVNNITILPQPLSPGLVSKLLDAWRTLCVCVCGGGECVCVSVGEALVNYNGITYVPWCQLDNVDTVPNMVRKRE